MSGLSIRFAIPAKQKVVSITGAEVIGVAPVNNTEGHKGKSTVRFALRGQRFIVDNEPFYTLSSWKAQEAIITMSVEGLDTLNCTLRECSLNPSQQELYIQVYTPMSPQFAQHWFMPDG